MTCADMLAKKWQIGLMPPRRHDTYCRCSLYLSLLLFKPRPHEQQRPVYFTINTTGRPCCTAAVVCPRLPIGTGNRKMEPVGGGCSSLVLLLHAQTRAKDSKTNSLQANNPQLYPCVCGHKCRVDRRYCFKTISRQCCIVTAPGSVRMQFLSPRLRRIAALPAVEGANAAAGVSTASAINVIVVSTAFMIPRERKVRAYNSDVCVPLLGAGCAYVL